RWPKAPWPSETVSSGDGADAPRSAAAGEDERKISRAVGRLQSDSGRDIGSSSWQAITGIGVWGSSRDEFPGTPPRESRHCATPNCPPQVGASPQEQASGMFLDTSDPPASL